MENDILNEYFALSFEFIILQEFDACSPFFQKRELDIRNEKSVCWCEMRIKHIIMICEQMNLFLRICRKSV